MNIESYQLVATRTMTSSGMKSWRVVELLPCLGFRICPLVFEFSVLGLMLNDLGRSEMSLVHLQKLMLCLRFHGKQSAGIEVEDLATRLHPLPRKAFSSGSSRPMSVPKEVEELSQFLSMFRLLRCSPTTSMISLGPHSDSSF